jgi:O-Antigen ligase
MVAWKLGGDAVRDGDASAVATRLLPGGRRLARRLGIALFVALGALLLAALFESWLGLVSGQQLVNGRGQLVVVPATWPQTLKSVLYVVIALLTAARFTVDRRWGQLRTRADLALVVLVVVLVGAGLFGPSAPKLIAQALFVYLRGAIVFYALRALDPSRLQLRRLLYLLGAVLVLDSAVSLVEMVVGEPAYRALGWVDMEWAKINRAHALFNHPNDLGHFVGLMLLGLIALIAVRDNVSKRLWALLVLVALALAASQSRESIIGVLLGLGVIALLRRANFVRLGVVAVLVFLAAVVPVVVSPANRAEWQRRLAGVTEAIQLPSGSVCDGEAGDAPDADGSAACPDAVPDREIRLLYLQQGAKLLERRPLLGYGVGQFGGIVAYQDDPNWNLDPRFRPTGFNRYGFSAKTVDSFWLHLVVETGVVGLAVYLVWLYLLAAPLIRVARRRRGRARAPAHPVFYWAPAAVLFVVFVAVLSPSLEDPLVPPLLFTIVGIAWVLLARGDGGSSATPRTLAEAGAGPIDSAPTQVPAITTMEQR